MQIFANGKRRFHSSMEFYVIHQKYQGVKIWSWYHFSGTNVTWSDVISKFVVNN